MVLTIVGTVSTVRGTVPTLLGTVPTVVQTGQVVFDAVPTNKHGPNYRWNSHKLYLGKSQLYM